MIKQEILNDFEKNFKKLKKELNLKTNTEELDRIFYIKDYVLQEGFASDNLPRQIGYRIVEIFMRWNEYLHGLIMPNPQNIINISESKILSLEDKKEITELIKKGMEIASKNTIIGLKRDSKAEAKFIDDSVNLWESEFKPKLLKIVLKINEEWGKTK